MQEKTKYINDHGSPITVSTDRDSDEKEALHNILTQEIMSKEICEDLLEFEISCNSRNEMFRTETFITKKRSIFGTIHRNNCKTFKSMKVEKRNSQSKVKGNNKQLAETQKIFDIARVQQYDITYLLCFDLIDNIYLFDDEGLMKKTSKSDLCTELEKVLHKSFTISMNPENIAQLLMSWDAYVACAYRPYENVTFPLTFLNIYMEFPTILIVLTLFLIHILRV